MFDLLPQSTPSAVVVFREVLEAALVVGIVMAGDQGHPRPRRMGARGYRRRRGRRLPGGAVRRGDPRRGFRHGLGTVQRHRAVPRGGHAGLALRLDVAPRPRDRAAHGCGGSGGGRGLRGRSMRWPSWWGWPCCARARRSCSSSMASRPAARRPSPHWPSAAPSASAAVRLLGLAIYLGLLRVPMRHLFAVTTWMIILLAAGMASQGAAFLVQADLLPALGKGLWDTSEILSEKQIVGQILHVLVGYNSRPSGIQTRLLSRDHRGHRPAHLADEIAGGPR